MRSGKDGGGKWETGRHICVREKVNQSPLWLHFVKGRALTQASCPPLDPPLLENKDPSLL
jgi:hypothetical protein